MQPTQFTDLIDSKRWQKRFIPYMGTLLGKLEENCESRENRAAIKTSLSFDSLPKKEITALKILLPAICQYTVDSIDPFSTDFTVMKRKQNETTLNYQSQIVLAMSDPKNELAETKFSLTFSDEQVKKAFFESARSLNESMQELIEEIADKQEESITREDYPKNLSAEEIRSKTAFYINFSNKRTRTASAAYMEAMLATYDGFTSEPDQIHGFFKDADHEVYPGLFICLPAIRKIVETELLQPFRDHSRWD